MSIEQTLERIALALETIAAAGGAPATPAEPAKKAATKKTTTAETPVAAEKPADPVPAKEAVAKGPTLDDVQAAVGKLLKANKRNEALQLLGQFNAKKASDIKPADYAKFMDEANDLILIAG